LFGLSKFRSRRRTPKEKPPKRKSRKPIPIRSTFKTFDNPLKSYRQRYPTRELIRRAEECRAKQLACPTAAGDAFGEILRAAGVVYQREAIYYRTGAFILIDFLAHGSSRKVAFEIDGAQHRLQRGYDVGRDRWLMQGHGIPTVRFWNKQVLDHPLNVAARVCAELGL
jgi:very-short-patch-repair endonuclease